MINNEIKTLLHKADELRSLFVLGQKVIPFLEEIFVFVSEIQPLLDEINKSITENLRKMPNASKQLSKVTEATELATNEIMDLVDGIVFNTDVISKNLNKIQKISDFESSKPLEILELVYNAIENGADVSLLLPDLRKLIDNLKLNINSEKKEIIFISNEILKTIQNDSSSIMISLQVQDITSQQIAAVNKLLETVQGKLESILNHFHESDLKYMINAENENDDYTNVIKVSKLHRDIAFDPNAIDSITNKLNRQNEVDDFMKKMKDEMINNHENSNPDANENKSTNLTSSELNDIGNISSDKLDDFAGDDTNINELNDEMESISQDDIDKMFK
jgi:chemotaxis regulatin CheY-phosphate phosphatase CheZ